MVYYVPQEEIHQHGKRVPLRVGGLLCIIPPRNARLAVQEIFPKGYWIGKTPAEDCSADVPKWSLKKEGYLKVFFARNPYRRVESLWRMHPSIRPVPSGGKWPKPSDGSFPAFVDWLTGKSSSYWGWPQTKWLKGGETDDKDMVWPKWDLDFIIQTEDLAGGINAMKVLETPLKQEDVEQIRIEGEWIRENVGTEWWEEYDKETIRKVRKTYFEDFEALGYPFDLEEA